MKREAEVEHTTVPPSGIGIRTFVAIAWGSLRQADLHTRHFIGAGPVSPKFVSPSDPAAQWTGAMRGPAPELRRNRLHAKLPTWWTVKVPLSRNRATGEVLRRYHVGVQEEPMPLTEKAATTLMTVAIAGVGPACVVLLLFL